jgi:PilZ domain
MSPGGMALIAAVRGQPGERVIAYVDHLGRLEGLVARQFENGFAMTIAATARKRDKLAAQLTWLANRHILNLPEDRRHGRITPRNPAGRLILANGINLACRVIDISQSGAAIATEERPDIGAPVTIGRTPGRVVRHLENGIAVEFTRLQHPDFLEDNVTGGQTHERSRDGRFVVKTRVRTGERRFRIRLAANRIKQRQSCYCFPAHISPHLFAVRSGHAR